MCCRGGGALGRVRTSTGLRRSTYSLGSEQIVVQSSEPLPGVVAAVSSAHQVFDHQADVDETDAVVRGQVSLQHEHTPRQISLGNRRNRQNTHSKVNHTHHTHSHKHTHTNTHTHTHQNPKFFVCFFGYERNHD